MLEWVLVVTSMMTILGHLWPPIFPNVVLLVRYYDRWDALDLFMSNGAKYDISMLEEVVVCDLEWACVGDE